MPYQGTCRDDRVTAAHGLAGTRAAGRAGSAAGHAGSAAGRAPSAPNRIWVPVLAALLAVGGCGVRLDTPPPDLPVPDAAETARQDAAVRAATIGSLADTAAQTDDDVALVRVAEEARTHVDALGGAWLPPAWASSPSPDAPPGATPAPGATAPETATRADVGVALATVAAETCTDAIAVEPVDLATLLASVCLAQRRGAADLGAPPGELPGAPAADARDAALTAAVAGLPEATELARALDAAGFALEVAAARADAQTREPAVARAAAHRADAVLVLQAAGALGTADDPRRAAYALADGDDAAAVESGVLAAWAAVVGEVASAERGAALAEMAAAEDAAHGWGAAPTAFPGLP